MISRSGRCMVVSWVEREAIWTLILGLPWAGHGVVDAVMAADVVSCHGKSVDDLRSSKRSATRD